MAGLDPYLTAELDLRPLTVCELQRLYEHACASSAAAYVAGDHAASEAAERHADRLEAEMVARGVL